MEGPSARSGIVVVRNVLHALQTMLNKQTHLTSLRWEREQRAKAARAAQSNPGGINREFRAS
eukprot:8547775-Pyramimonas_sp.AAC.1